MNSTIDTGPDSQGSKLGLGQDAQGEHVSEHAQQYVGSFNSTKHPGDLNAEDFIELEQVQTSKFIRSTQEVTKQQTSIKSHFKKKSQKD